jgi:hypothetical protein
MGMQTKECIITTLIRDHGKAEILRLAQTLPEHSKWCPGCEKAINIDEYGEYNYCTPCYRQKQKEYRDLNPGRKR